MGVPDVLDWLTADIPTLFMWIFGLAVIACLLVVAGMYQIHLETCGELCRVQGGILVNATFLSCGCQVPKTHCLMWDNLTQSNYNPWQSVIPGQAAPTSAPAKEAE
jgi:hypothetical protein